MYRSYALHQIDLNDIARTERWYATKHGPEIARRYGPWLARFESFRPVELPEDARTGYGSTNYFCTEGMWRDLPDPADNGFLGMTQPVKHARPFSCMVNAQPEDDFKGGGDAPDRHFVLRWVQLLEYPEGVDKAAADAWYTGPFAQAACQQGSLNRFFSFQAVKEALHVPGHWAEGESTPDYVGVPADHRWDRVTEMWFDDFDGWRAFVNAKLPAPDWAQTERVPFLTPYDNFVSAFLLEIPAYDWLRIDRAFL